MCLPTIHYIPFIEIRTNKERLLKTKYKKSAKLNESNNEARLKN